jgi:hypothetical protein
MLATKDIYATADANLPAFSVIPVAVFPKPSLFTITLPVAFKDAFTSRREGWAVIGTHPSTAIAIAVEVVIPVTITVAFTVPIAAITVKITISSWRWWGRW